MKRTISIIIICFFLSTSFNIISKSNQTDSIYEREIRALKEFEEKYKSKIKKLIILSENINEKKDGIEIVPICNWLITN